MYCTFALFSIFSLYFYFYYKRFVTFWQKLFESTKILSNWNKILTFISKIKCRTFIEHFIAIFYWVWKTFWYLPCLELLITKNRFYKVVKRGHCISNCFKIYSFHKLNDNITTLKKGWFPTSLKMIFNQKLWLEIHICSVHQYTLDE